jgi:phage baseplate assembly protein W
MSDYRIGTSCDHYIFDLALDIDGTSPGYTSTLLYEHNGDATAITIREFSSTEGLTNFLRNVNGITNFSLDNTDPTLLHFNTLGFPPGVNYVEGLTVVQPSKLYLASYTTTTASCPLCAATNVRRDVSFDRAGSFNVIAGHAKVSQQVLKILLTTVGSNRLNADYGSLLSQSIGQRLDLALEFQIQQSVQTAINLLIDQQRQTTQDLPLDETIVRLSALQLTRDANDPRVLQIVVKVTTADLEEVEAQLTLPVS